MTTFTCFNECKEGWNMQNQQPVFIECKMRCEAWEGRLRVHSWIQICLYTSRMRAREKNASHRFFYVYALLFFCMRHLTDLVQLQVSSVGRRLFKQAVKASSIVPFFCPSCPPWLSLPRWRHYYCFVRLSWVCVWLAATMSRGVYAMCVCVLLATSILLSVTPHSWLWPPPLPLRQHTHSLSWWECVWNRPRRRPREGAKNLLVVLKQGERTKTCFWMVPTGTGGIPQATQWKAPWWLMNLRESLVSLPPHPHHMNMPQVCVCFVADLFAVHARRLLDTTQHKFKFIFLHPCAHTLTCDISTCNDLHDPLLYICHYYHRKPGAPNWWEDTRVAWSWPTQRSAAVRHQRARHVVWRDTRLTTSCGNPRLAIIQIVSDIHAHACVYTWAQCVLWHTHMGV